MDKKQVNAETIQEIYELQALIGDCRRDAQKIADHISRGVAGREVALAITKLQEAHLWLQQAMTELLPKPPTTGEYN